MNRDLRGDNARLGVEITTKRATSQRDREQAPIELSIGQWYAAHADRNWLEKARLAGPRMESSSREEASQTNAGPKEGADYYL